MNNMLTWVKHSRVNATLIWFTSLVHVNGAY